MSFFRIVVLGFFILGAVIGVIIFAVGGIGGGASEQIGTVKIWGTLEKKTVSSWLEETSKRPGVNVKLNEVVKYTQRDLGEYESSIINAMASGNAPDLFFLPQDKILKFKDKIQTIPYKSYSEKRFRSTFVEEGELYLGKKGIYGLPVILNPMVMYWNRSMFSTAGIAQPPQFWKKIYTLSEKMSKVDESSNVLRSAVALGEYTNIKHAKEILSAMMVQAGTPIIKKTKQGLTPWLTEKPENMDTIPAVAGLRYYTEFSNPSRSVYSWNRSLQEARQEFVRGDLGVYFGFASELPLIRKANPNLNFGVSTFPRRSKRSAVNFGKMKALAIPKSAKNISGAFKVAGILSGKQSGDVLSENMGLPPVRRDLLSRQPKKAYRSVFYKAALTADAWLDPAPKKTERIFSTMIRSVTSGGSTISKAVGRADSQVNALLGN